MTKIKNTKKGMAKKTLSMSLVVAMLATSNVPVWAAEFSDGSDVAVATEAPAEFADETEAPVVEDATEAPAEATVTSDSYSVAPTFTGVTKNSAVWNSTIAGSFNFSMKKGTSYDDVRYYYAWKVDGVASGKTEVLADKTTKEWSDFLGGSAVTLNLNSPTLAASDAGKNLTLFVYAVANDNTTVWSYTSDAIALKAVDRTEQMKNIAFKSDFALTYDGNQKTITKDNINWGSEDPSKYDIAISSSDDTNVTTDNAFKVTITPNETGFTGKKELTVGIGSQAISSSADAAAAFTATLKTTNYVYTGSAIKVKASDITLVDTKTKADLSAYLVKDANGYVTLTNAPTNAGSYNLTVGLITGTPESGNKNYSIASGVTVTTSNQATIAVRDLSTVTASIKAMPMPSNAAGYAPSDLTITYKDSATGDSLTLAGDVDVAIPKNATTAGAHTVTIEAKTGNENVKGKTTATLNLVNADISAAKFTGLIPSTNTFSAEEYTGTAITKTDKQLGNLMLNGSVVNKSEYDVEYANNTNAGTATIIVKGKNSFAGSEARFTFTINPAAVSNDTISANTSVEVKDTQNASDYKDTFGLVVKAKNANNKEFTLTEGTDYTVKYTYGNTNKGVGGTVVASVTITNKNYIKNNVKIFTKNVTIAPKALKTANIKLKENSFTYTGKAITPDFDIVIDGKVISPAKYTVSYTNNINAGTATITVKGVAGSTEYDPATAAKLNFEIKPADTTKLVGVIGAKEYKGYSLEVPADEISLKLGDSDVDVASNFKLTYGENLKIGEGTVTLTPKNGNFTGTKTLTFNIVGKNVSAENAIKTYDANGIETNAGFGYDGTAHTYAKAVASITKDGKKLVEGTDYDLVYVDNVYGKRSNGTQYGAILAVAKGTYGGSLDNGDVVKGVYTDAVGNKTANVIAIKKFEIGQQNVNRSNITVKNATYAGGVEVKPVVNIVVKGVTLVEGKDYDLETWGESLSNVTTGKTNGVEIIFKNGYCASDNMYWNWGIDKFDLANADVTVDGDKVTVKCGRVDVETSEYTVEKKDGKVTVTANKTSKNYKGSKTVNAATEIGAPVISSVKVVGNKATVILSGDVDGASGYDYVISKANDTTNARVDVTKNQAKTTGDFTYVQQGTYYAYCHAWTRNAEGKKVFGEWSNIYPFSVSAITPAQPVITSVKAKGTTVTVTYTKAANAEGYDVVLGSTAKKVNGEYRPVEYGKLVKKNIKGNVVTATFKNVKKGTYYAGLHAFNKTSEDGKKVFSQWSNVKKVTVK